MVNVINDKHASKEIHDQFTVFFISLHKRIGSSYNTGLIQHISLIQPTPSTDVGKRKKCSTSESILLQETDHTFGCLFVICNDILYASTQCCFDGNFVILLYMDDISYNTFDTGFPAFLFHDTANAVPVTIVAFSNIFQRFQTGCLSMISGLSNFHLGILFFKFILQFLDFTIQANTFFICGTDQCRYRIILFLCIRTFPFQYFFFTFEAKDSLTDFCLADIQLFQHGIKTLHFTFCCCPAVKNLNDLIFAVLNCLCTFFYIGDDIFQRFCFLCKFAANFFQAILQFQFIFG